MRRQLVKKVGVLFCGVLLNASSAVATVTFDWAVIGNAGNAADTEIMNDGTSGYGSVGYEYSIATTEVTNAQYIEFLTAVAKTDTYGLYNSGMGGTYGGITQSGTSGSYSYSLKNNDENWANRPVVCVSWYDALRFINWLHNGQLSVDRRGTNATTTEYGVYDMSLGTSVVRLAGADYWLPSEDEWYKAAYYDPVAGVYYDYATSSNDVPVSGVDANYPNGGFVDPVYYTTEVGEYDNESPYGTYDQNGNVWEWNEALISGVYRGMRGGAWNSGASLLPASLRSYADSTAEDPGIGFRIASSYTELAIPEPASVGLVLLSVGGLVLRRRRKA